MERKGEKAPQKDGDERRRPSRWILDYSDPGNDPDFSCVPERPLRYTVVGRVPTNDTNIVAGNLRNPALLYCVV